MAEIDRWTGEAGGKNGYCSKRGVQETAGNQHTLPCSPRQIQASGTTAIKQTAGRLALLGFVFFFEVIGDGACAFKTGNGSGTFGQYGSVWIQFLDAFDGHDCSRNFLSIFQKSHDESPSNSAAKLFPCSRAAGEYHRSLPRTTGDIIPPIIFFGHKRAACIMLRAGMELIPPQASRRVLVSNPCANI
jgi:hypothetical protein